MQDYFRDLREQDMFGDDLFGDIEAEEPGFVAEIGAFERAGPGGRLAEMLTVTDIKGKETLSSEDRVLLAINGIGNTLIDEKHITRNDLENILEMASVTENMKYKNPVGFILGYIGTNGGKLSVNSVKTSSSVDKKILNELKSNIKNINNKILPSIKDRMGIEEPDVIRYIRFWGRVK